MLSARLQPFRELGNLGFRNKLVLMVYYESNVKYFYDIVGFSSSFKVISA